MIVSFLFTIVSYLFALINGIQGFIDFILPAYLLAWISESTNILIVANGFMPIAAAFKVFGLFLSIEIGFLLIKAVTGLISLIRGGGSMEI